MALRALTRRFPDLARAGDADDLAFRDLAIVYTLDRLPVRLTREPLRAI